MRARLLVAMFLALLLGRHLETLPLPVALLAFCGLVAFAWPQRRRSPGPWSWT